MTYSQPFLDEMRRRLEEEKKRLESDLMTIAKRDPKHHGNFVPQYHDVDEDSDVNAQESSEYQTEISVGVTLEDQLRRVESALKKMEEGTYGQTSEGDFLSEEKLEVDPAAGATDHQ